MKQFFTILSLSIVFFASCSNYNEQEPSLTQRTTSSAEIVSVETALNRLDSFLSETNMTATRDGQKRRVASIATKYCDNEITRAGDSLPVIYILNFSDNEGFAILGANSKVSPIIAVTESGEIDPKTLYVKDSNNEVNQPFFSSYLDLSIYSESTDEELTRATTYATVPALMIPYRFSQIRTYCHDDNNGASISASGCGPTAVSMAVAYNNFPVYRAYTRSGLTILDYSLVNDSEETASCFYFIDSSATTHKYYKVFINRDDYFDTDNYRYSSTNPDSIAIGTPLWPLFMLFDGMPYSEVRYYPTAYYARTQFLLQACVFYEMDVNPGLDVTSATNGDIEDCLSSMGYTNIHKRTALSITNNMLNDISNMLQNNKPVIAGGYSITGLFGHFWIIDGGIYSGSQYLIHCNWGWGGNCNGYFKPAGTIKTHQPYNGMYDQSFNSDSSSFQTFATFTYDLPINQYSKTCFLDTHYSSAFGN